MRLSPDELRRQLAANPDLQLVTDADAYTTLEPAGASATLIQADVHNEHTLQAAVIAECDRRALTDTRWGDIYANVNGQFRPGARMEPGLRRGVPDLFLPVACRGWHGLYLELKWGKNKPDADQLLWHVRLKKSGYLVRVLWDDVAEVIGVIEWYLGGKE